MTEGYSDIGPLTGFFLATIRLATPLLLAALGESVAERAGILNLGVEGMMLTGALFGFLGAHYGESLWMGWMAAILAGALLALLFAYFTISLRAHQVIIALGINLLALGGTGFIYRQTFGLSTSTPQIATAGLVPIPFLSQIPVIGPVFFRHTLLVYVAFLLVLVLSFFLFRTPMGLNLRAVGEHARAADTVGVNVYLTRYLATVFGGAMAGLAGAYLSTVELDVFIEGMTGGVGWIAVAVVIFGNWNPIGIMAASLAFGGAQALQLRLQGLGLEMPREFLVMIPYVLTLVALAGLVRRSNPPAQICIPYIKEESG